jgi:hypothetical protein
LEEISSLLSSLLFSLFPLPLSLHSYSASRIKKSTDVAHDSFESYAEAEEENIYAHLSLIPTTPSLSLSLSLSLSPTVSTASSLSRSSSAQSSSPAKPKAKASEATGASATAVKLEEASIVSHELRQEDKRFTAYKIEIVVGQKRYAVFHRYD